MAKKKKKKSYFEWPQQDGRVGCPWPQFSLEEYWLATIQRQDTFVKIPEPRGKTEALSLDRQQQQQQQQQKKGPR